MLVVECLALGMEQFKVKIVELIKEVLAADGINIRGVYERSDANERKKEGLPKVKGFIGAEFDTNVEIVENAVHYMVDVENGQKTGFFLDQKYNRLAMQRICKGKRVLDCFTHMGTFALNAGIAGASEVTGLDISEYAVKQATENAKRNNLSDTVKFRVANVLDELPRLAADGEKYDVVYVSRHNIGETLVYLMSLKLWIRADGAKKPAILVWREKDLPFYEMFIEKGCDILRYDVSQSDLNYFLCENITVIGKTQVVCPTFRIAEAMKMAWQNGDSVNFVSAILQSMVLSTTEKITNLPKISSHIRLKAEVTIASITQG